MDCKNEAEKLMDLCGQDMYKTVKHLESQLNVLHTRAQVLLSLAGIIMTVTGFSGRRIAGAGLLGQVSIIAGLTIVLASVIWMFSRVMPIRWVTTQITDDQTETICRIVNWRNRKTRAYLTGGYILFAGILCYCIGFAQMLLQPQS